jgi:hypothetical protein
MEPLEFWRSLIFPALQSFILLVCSMWQMAMGTTIASVK